MPTFGPSGSTGISIPALMTALENILVQGSNVNLLFNDTTSKITIGASYSVLTEDIQDAAAAMLVNGTQTGITFVYDDAGNRINTTVTATSGSSGFPPSANAGPDQTVTAGAAVTLSGSLSTDPQSLPLSYNWSQISGSPTYSLAGSGATRTFTPTLAGTYVFGLNVSNTIPLTSTTDTVTITVVAGGGVTQAPVANAGADQFVLTGASVTISGAGSSDPQGLALTYAWTQTSGPATAISGTGAARTFTVPVAGTYNFTVTVSNGSLSSSDSITIKVTDAALTGGTPPGTTLIGGVTAGTPATTTFTSTVTGGAP